MTAVAPAAPLATSDDWSRFMRPVAMAVRNTPSDDEFRARVAAIFHAVHVPADWLRQPWRQAEAMRRFAFWPAVFDVAELFAEDLRAYRESVERRERLALPAPEPVRGPRSAAEILAVQAKAREVAATLAAEPAPAAPPTAKAMPLSDGALLAHYQRMADAGDRNAAWRVGVLRQRIEAAANG